MILLHSTLLYSTHSTHSTHFSPNQKVTMNGGMKMAAWYDIIGLSESSSQDSPGILLSASSVLRLIVEETAHSGIKQSKIVVGGFSQGGAVALTTGLLYKTLSVSEAVTEDFAGIMGLSTYLPIQEHFKAQEASVARSTPVLMLHGTNDGVVSHRWGKQSAKLMQEDLKCSAVEFKSIQGLAHSVTSAEIEMMAEFMKQRLRD
jgi:predicted esterase